MLRQIRKFTWLIPVVVLVLGLTIGAALAHEGRPVGDYRFTVGWQEEPAYEGVKNAVSVRVNKIVEGSPEEVTSKGDDNRPLGQTGDSTESTPPMAGNSGKSAEATHGPPGHHGEETKAPPVITSGEKESEENEGHHEAEGEVSEEGEDHHGTEDEDSASMAHEGGGHHDATIEAGSEMSISLNVSGDLISGANVQIITEGFTFAPDSVNKAHVDGEGHAHIYVDDVKISRVYTPWFYLGDLTPGDHEIQVKLNANNLEEYVIAGEQVEAVTQFSFQEPHGHGHAAETVEAVNRMAVGITLEPDPLGGANLFVATEGFTFTPQNAGDHHVAGEGHAHVSVNGTEVGRLYGDALQLGWLEEGENEITVTLNTNDFSDYLWNGAKVEATATIHIEAGMGGGGYGGSSTHGDAGHNRSSVADSDEETETARSVTSQGAAKPLASMAGQHEGVAVPVEGLEGSVKVEVTHTATGASRTFDLEAVWGDPGHYVAGLIPTASGVYEFRVFGTIEGMDIEETFVSQGAGGDFDDVQSSAELQFPEQLPEIREIVAAAQGARTMAQQAQDTALANQNAGGGSGLAVVALIVGIVGAVLGAGGILVAMRSRQTQ